jgi:hypothetical protein
LFGELIHIRLFAAKVKTSEINAAIVKSQRESGFRQGTALQLVGPDFRRVGLERIDVDHPAENLGNPTAADVLTGVFSGDRAG